MQSRQEARGCLELFNRVTEMKKTIDMMNLVIGGKYNWKNQPERLIYLGVYIGGGRWHQFAKVDSQNVVWCEVHTSDLCMMEETN